VGAIFWVYFSLLCKAPTHGTSSAFSPATWAKTGTNGQGQTLVRPHAKVRQVGHSTTKNWQGLALGRLNLHFKTSTKKKFFSILQVICRFLTKHNHPWNIRGSLYEA
jgi:hypothetical protein